jgi:hypothetical protein
MSNVSLASDRVPVAPLREAFLASGLTLSQVCYRLGWTCPHGRYVVADTSRLQRSLGMRALSQPGRYTNHHIGYEHATRIARAIGVEPYEVGL